MRPSSRLKKLAQTMMKQLVLAYCRHSHVNKPHCVTVQFSYVLKNLSFFQQLFLPNSSLEQISSQGLKIPPLVSQVAPV